MVQLQLQPLGVAQPQQRIIQLQLEDVAGVPPDLSTIIIESQVLAISSPVRC